jgi:hypothetical protein
MKKNVSNISRIINWCGTTISGIFMLSFRGSNCNFGSTFDGDTW